jgi:hypothetical protein
MESLQYKCLWARPAGDSSVLGGPSPDFMQVGLKQ